MLFEIERLLLDGAFDMEFDDTENDCLVSWCWWCFSGVRKLFDDVVIIFTSIGFTIAHGLSPKYGHVHGGGSSRDVVSPSFLLCCFLVRFNWLISSKKYSSKSCSSLSRVCILFERLNRIEDDDFLVLLNMFSEALRFDVAVVSTLLLRLVPFELIQIFCILFVCEE